MPDAVIEFGASVAAYQAEMAKIAGMTDKTAAAAALKIVTANQKMTASAKDYVGQAAKTNTAQVSLAKSSNMAAQGFRSVAVQLPDVITQLQMGVSPMTIVSQQGLQIVQVWGMIPGLLGAVGGAFAWATPVILGAAAAGYLWYQDAKLAKIETLELGGVLGGYSLALKDYKKLQDAGNTSLEAFWNLVDDTRSSLAVLSGAMSQLDADIDKSNTKIAKAIETQAKAAASGWVQTQTNLAAAQAAYQAAWQAGLGEGEGMEYVPAFEARALEVAKAQEEAARTGLETLKQYVIEEKVDAAVVVELTDKKKGLGKATSDLAEAEKERWEWASQALDVDRATMALYGDIAAAAQELGQWFEEWGAAEAELADIAQDASDARLTADEKIIVLRDRQLAQIYELATRTGDWATATVAANDIIATSDEQAAKNAIDLRKRQQEAMTDVLGSALGGLADIAEFAAERFAAAGNDEAARKAFGAWKAFSVATAIMQGLQSAIAAYAATVIIPVVGPALAPVAAGVALAATGLMIAKIESTEMPTYHSGGLAADEGLALLTRQERILTRQEQNNMGGTDAVNRAARGGGSQVIRVQQIWKGKIYTDFMYDMERANPAKPATRAGKRAA